MLVGIAFDGDGDRLIIVDSDAKLWMVTIRIFISKIEIPKPNCSRI